MPNFRLQQTLDIKKIYFKNVQIFFYKEKYAFYFFVKFQLFRLWKFSAKSSYVMPNFRLQQTLDIKF